MTLRKGLTILILSLFLGPADTAVAQQCMGGHLDVYEGCALERSEMFEPRGTGLTYTCRQKLEARLFYGQLKFLEARKNAIQMEMEGTTSAVDRFLNIMTVIEGMVSILELGQGVYQNDIPGLALKDIQLIEGNTGAAGSILSDYFGIDPVVASDMVQLAIDEASTILTLTGTVGKLDAFTLSVATAAKVGTIFAGMWGTLVLTDLTAEMNANLIGWWYLEDFYHLGGTFDGSGIDAHGLVADLHGLSPASDIHTVIAEISAEKNFNGNSLFNWWFTEVPVDLDQAVAFAEQVKAAVADLMAQEDLNRRFAVDIELDELFFGTETDAVSPLGFGVSNIDSEILTFCWTARHGTISGSYEGGFVYQAPAGVIDEGDPLANTEEITLTVNNGLQQLQDVATFRLYNEQIYLVFSVDDTSPGELLRDDDIKFKIDGEPQWRDFLDRESRYILPGSHTIEFLSADGFMTPPLQGFTAPNQGSSEHAFVLVTYEPAAAPRQGAVRVDLNRPEGRWRILGESTWRASGNVATGLTFGVYDIEFLPITGWVRPSILQAFVEQESTVVVAGDYTAIPVSKGSLELDLVGSTDFIRFPDMGFWRVEGDELWRSRDYRYEQLPAGSATVVFHKLFGWIKPAAQTVAINAGINQVTAQYLLDTGVTFPVGGWVLNNSVGIEGVTITGLPDGPVVTDRFGNYGVKVPDGWQGTLMASRPGMTFEPASIDVHIVGTWDNNNTFRLTDTPPVPDRTEPVVRILAPLLGETARTGDTLIVRWSAEDDRGVLRNVKLQYKNVVTNLSWTTLAEGLEETTEYSWEVPDQKATPTRVRVVAEDVAGNIGSADSDPFTLGDGGRCMSPDRAPRLKPWVSTPHAYYTIDWLDVTNAVSYILQEDTHPSFSSPIEYTPTESFQYITGKPRDTYYYRVKAVGSCGSSPWSVTEDYVVLANQGPGEPAVPVPANGAQGISRSLVEVLWAGGDGDGDRVEYDVYFGRSEPLSKICSRTASQSCDMEGPLLPGTPYFWKVVAIDEHGARTTGPIWTLTTESIFPDLGIDSFTVDDTTPTFEGVVNATVNVSNQGNEPADDTFVHFYVESFDGTTSYLITRVTVPPLAIGASTVITAPLNLPANFLGAFALVARLNKNNSVLEQNRANNEVQIALTITDSEAPTVTVVRPRTDLTYRTGFEMEIRWLERDNEGIGMHSIHYSVSAGPWLPIVEETLLPYEGFDWTIPDALENTSIRVRVTVWDHSGNATQAVSDTASITTGVAPVVTVLSPTGGEQLLSNTPFNVRWEATSPVGITEIDLGLYLNGSRTETIARDLPNTGSFSWSPGSHLINRDFIFGVEARGTNGVETLQLAPASFRVVDSFQIPLPWNTPREVFTMPAPPPVPPNAYNFGLPPAWSQSINRPRIAVDSNGTVHCIALYSESIRMRNPGANWTYFIGNEGVIYRTYSNGTFGPQSRRFFVNYDESTGFSEDFGMGPWLADSQGDLHLAYVISSSTTTFDGASPQVFDREVHHIRLANGTWTSSVNISQTANATSNSPALAVTSDGTVHIAWRERISGHSQVYYRSLAPGGGGWGPGLILDYGFLPSLLADTADELILVSQRSSPVFETVLMRHDGSSWSAPETVWPGSTGGHTPKMALSPGGDPYTYVVNGNLINVSRLTAENRRDWVYGFPNVPGGTETSMFFDSQGTPHLGYLIFQDGLRVVVERRVHEDGSFGPMNFVDSTAGEASEIRSVSNASGMAYTIWHESLQVGIFEPILLNHASFTNDLDPPTVAVSAPTGAQTLDGGSAVDIQWTANDNVAVTSIDLRYSTDGAVSYQTIALSEPNDGHFSWTLPEQDLATVLIAVETRDANGNVGVGLSQTFAIAQPSGEVTLLSPNGSEQFLSGEVIDLSWAGAEGATIGLEFSLDDGTIWSLITENLAGTSTFSWTLPTTNTDRARVRITADFASGESSMDTSDGAFSIQVQAGPFTPYSPQPPVNAGYVAAGATLTWIGGHSDPGASLTYRVLFGNDLGSLATRCTTTATSCALPAALAANTQYFWQVVADDGSVTVGSPIWTFHTGDPSGLLPPEDLAAVQQADGSVALVWDDQNTDPGLVHIIEKQWPGTTTFQSIAQQSGGLRSFDDPDVEGNQAYVYRVRTQRLAKGVGAPETSGASNEEHIEVDNLSPHRPSSPDPSTGLAIPTQQPAFSWSGGDPDAQDTVLYQLDLWAPSILRDQLADLSQPRHDQLSPLAANTLYSWQVTARDDRGGESIGPVWSFETPAEVPAAPQDPVVFQAGDRVVLGWAVDPAPGEGLFVERRLASSRPFELIELWPPRELSLLPRLTAIDADVAALVAGVASDGVTYRVGVYNEEGFFSYSDLVSLTVTPSFSEADLGITIDNGRTTVVAGETVTYTVVVANSGPTGVDGATISYSPPATLANVSWECLGQDEGTCSAMGSGPIGDTADLPVGAVVTYTVTGHLDPAATGSLIGTASIQMPAGLVVDPNAGNDTATDTDPVTSVADLGIALIGDPPEVVAGGSMTYSIAPVNEGPSLARGVEIAFMLPNGAVFVDAGGNGWTCAESGGTVSCQEAELGLGIAQSLSVEVLAPDVGATATATITSAAGDPDPSNNSAAASFTILAPARILAVASVADTGDGTVSAGEATTAALTQLLVVFSTEMLNAAETANYLLVNAGSDGIFTTTDCATGIDAGDVAVSIGPVSYDSVSRTTVLRMTAPSALAPGKYRLLVCSQGLQNLNGQLLDGDGDGVAGGDYTLDWTASSQNLLVNPNFDDGLASWQVSNVTDVSHDSTVDATASSSGSTSLTNLSGGVSLSISQCVDIADGRAFLVGGKAKVASAFAPDPAVGVAVDFYAQASCIGNVLGSELPIDLMDYGSGLWRSVHGSGSVMQGTASARVTFVVDAGSAAVFDAWVDEVYFVKALFVDGFEIGNTSAWSSRTP